MGPTNEVIVSKWMYGPPYETQSKEMKKEIETEWQ